MLSKRITKRGMIFLILGAGISLALAACGSGGVSLPGFNPKPTNTALAPLVEDIATPIPRPTATTGIPTLTPSAAPSNISLITFFYDANLNGIQDAGEPVLSDLMVQANHSFYDPGSDGRYTLPLGKLALVVYGKAPSGKLLKITTLQEPSNPVSSNSFEYDASQPEAKIGLVDGCITSPVKPGEMDLKEYDSWITDANKAKWYSERLYPRGWEFPYTFNYFLYGQKILGGDWQDRPRLGFNMRVQSGAEIHAVAGGVITEGLENQFGIQNDCGTFYYNEILPTVKVGQKVNRYDVVGHAVKGLLTTLYLEVSPRPQDILDIFPGVPNGAMLTDPRKGEKVYSLPYFGK